MTVEARNAKRRLDLDDIVMLRLGIAIYLGHHAIKEMGVSNRSSEQFYTGAVS
jgi:hypothetical protein